jgi:tripartite-type tricarboxylate transporter receptor subunit TctC
VPKNIIDDIGAETRKAMTDTALQKAMTDSGFEPILDSGPAEAGKMVASELARWTPIIKKIGFTQ